MELGRFGNIVISLNSSTLGILLLGRFHFFTTQSHPCWTSGFGL